jgi:yecA family protein
MTALVYSYDELDAILRGDGRGDVIGMSAIDGLIAALAAGPVFIPPDAWLPLIFAGRRVMTVAGTPEHRAVNTILHRYDEVSSTLAERPAAYRPLFMHHDGEVIVRDWAVGFMLGVGQRAAAWSGILIAHRRKTLAPILAAYDLASDLLFDVPQAEKDHLKASAHRHIADTVVAIHRICSPQRTPAPRAAPNRSTRRTRGKAKRR